MTNKFPFFLFLLAWPLAQLGTMELWSRRSILLVGDLPIFHIAGLALLAAGLGSWLAARRLYAGRLPRAIFVGAATAMPLLVHQLCHRVMVSSLSAEGVYADGSFHEYSPLFLYVLISNAFFLVEATRVRESLVAESPSG